MSWFKKLLPSKIRTSAAEKKGVPEGIWSKCDACGAVLYTKELVKSQYVCPKCRHHMRLSARERLLQFLDADSAKELAQQVEAVDHLKFKDTKKYKDRLVSARKASGETEGLVVMAGKVYGLDVVACAFNFQFIGGSMGSGVGEKFVQGINAALSQRCPFICFSASGGARMQEGLLSLLQMSKTSAAIKRLHQAALPFISVLTDPTMGGVSASLAMLGDIIIAEPNALIGFAGPRVIKQTVREDLPEGFQRSEFLLENGAIDMVIDRKIMRPTVARLLAKLMHQTVTIPDEAFVVPAKVTDDTQAA